MKIYFDGSKLRSGEMVPGCGGRWCREHKMVHGFLYKCEHYPDHVLEEIEKDDNRRKALTYSIITLMILVTMMCGGAL